MKKKRVAALVMAAILGVTGFSVPGIGVVQAEEAHTEMSGEAEQQEINLAADRGSTARASKFLAASGNLPARELRTGFNQQRLRQQMQIISICPQINMSCKPGIHSF